MAFAIAFQVVAVELLGDWIKTKRLNWVQWVVTVGIGLVTWPLTVLSRMIPIKEPDVHDQFGLGDLKDEAKEILDKLEQEIKECIGARLAENRPFGEATAKYQRTLPLPRPVGSLWQKAKDKSFGAIRAINAFKRAHLDRDLHSLEGKGTYVAFKKTISISL